MRARLIVGDEDRGVEVENVAISSSDLLKRSLSEYMAGANATDDEADSTAAVDEAIDEVEGAVGAKRDVSVRGSVPHLLT